MGSAILENEKSLPRPSVASIMPKENEKQASTKATSKDKQPPVAVGGGAEFFGRGCSAES